MLEPELFVELASATRIHTSPDGIVRANSGYCDLSLSAGDVRQSDAADSVDGLGRNRERLRLRTPARARERVLCPAAYSSRNWRTATLGARTCRRTA